MNSLQNRLLLKQRFYKKFAMTNNHSEAITTLMPLFEELYVQKWMPKNQELFNLKCYVESLEELSDFQKKKIYKLHNLAPFQEIYG